MTTERGLRGGLGRRLLIAQALLLLAGAGTSGLVASIVGPGIFHSHLLEARAQHGDPQLVHIERAFRDSLLIAMGVALLVSVVTALAVTAWFTHRVSASTTAVVQATRRITAGQYSARVPPSSLGDEFDSLGATVNDLAQRLEDTERTRRRLLSDLGHELRTPIATIEMHLDAVEDGVRDPDDSMLQVIRGSAARLHRLADDVAAVSRAQEQQLRVSPLPTDLAEAARAAARTAQDAFARKEVSLTLHAPSAVPAVVDQQRMQQVLANLLANALRHTPTGGHVRLVARPLPDGGAELRVEDDGEGIAPEHLPHLFERFYRSDPARSTHDGGTGIGLTICRAIIEAHGGTIDAASDGPARGAALVVRLPTAPADCASDLATHFS